MNERDTQNSPEVSYITVDDEQEWNRLEMDL